MQRSLFFLPYFSTRGHHRLVGTFLSEHKHKYRKTVLRRCSVVEAILVAVTGVSYLLFIAYIDSYIYELKLLPPLTSTMAIKQ